MKLRPLVACLALMASAPTAFAALASCGAGTTAMPLGSMESFGNAFSSAQTFADCYRFSVDTTASVWGGSLTVDPLSYLDIVISSISLHGTGWTTDLVATSPNMFMFSNLGAGTYDLVVSGYVVRGRGWDDILPLPVAYGGSLLTTPSVPVAVPEPASLALLGLGLAGLAACRRRKPI